jgi:predicted transcriptional regulator
MADQREITDALKRGMEAYVRGEHAYARKLLEWALTRMKENAQLKAKKL